MNYKNYFIFTSIIILLAIFAFYLSAYVKPKVNLTAGWSIINDPLAAEVYENLDLESIFGEQEAPMVFRLSISSSFDEALVITVSIHESETIADVRRYAQIERYGEKSEITLRQKVVINELMRDKFLENISNSGLLRKKPEKGNIGLDGNTWKVEANIDGTYMVVSEWSPDSGVVYQFGWAIIEVSNASAWCRHGHGC